MDVFTRVTTPCVLHGVHQRQSVHDRAHHAHVIRRGAVHTVAQADLAAPQIAGADDNGYIDAHFAHFLYPSGNIQRSAWINTRADVAPEGFSTQFQ